MTLDLRLAAALPMLATAMERAAKPWWVIGSAAVSLHGLVTPVADIDLLLDVTDVAAIFEEVTVPVASGQPDGRFYSDVFGRWDAAPLTVEFMAGLHVRQRANWEPVSLKTRVGVNGVFVPAVDELAALLRRFGRSKDLDRARLLDAIS